MSKFARAAALPSIAVALALAAPPLARADNYALLVGVSSYPNLAQRYQLAGPANDVALVRALLGKHGFSEQHIHVLADGVPQARDPTRANIMAELARLVDLVKPGDFVYLHFAGHGSQQPTTAGKMPPEPDGKDEIFLPRDIGKWDGQLGSVENALIDSDMNGAVTGLRKRGAFVWVVFDSCHSGTMTRSVQPDDVRFRQVDPAAMAIPDDAFSAAARTSGTAATTRGAVEAKSGPLGPLPAALGGIVAFYAAQSVETTPEMPLPAGAPGRQSRGLFSYVLAETLEQYPGISYRQLGQQVLQHYAALGMNSPTPMFEGTALDAPVFGIEAGPAVLQWPLQVSRGELSIQAGTLNQFDVGAVFALLPSAAADVGEAAGYLRASAQTPLSSVLEPLAYAGKAAPPPAALTAGRYVRLVDPNIRLSLRVALPPWERRYGDAPSAGSVQEQVARQVIDELRARPVPGIQIEWVDAGKEADVRLRLADNRLWLAGPDGEWMTAGARQTHSISLAAPMAGWAEKLHHSFQKIGKVTNLLRIASVLGSKDAAAGARGLEVKAIIIRAAGGTRHSFDVATLPQVFDGDRIELVFRNLSKGMVDVTALYIDSEYGITAMYPAAGQINRIEADASDSMTIEIGADTTGTERLLVFAVPARTQEPATDFSFLAQQRLIRRRVTGNALDSFVEDASLGTRSAIAVRAPVGAAELKVYGWRVAGK